MKLVVLTSGGWVVVPLISKCMNSYRIRDCTGYHQYLWNKKIKVVKEFACVPRYFETYIFTRSLTVPVTVVPGYRKVLIVKPNSTQNSQVGAVFIYKWPRHSFKVCAVRLKKPMFKSDFSSYLLSALLTLYCFKFTHLLCLLVLCKGRQPLLLGTTIAYLLDEWAKCEISSYLRITKTSVVC